jgi:Mn-dependent DtxR family transcriptional regulator
MSARQVQHRLSADEVDDLVRQYQADAKVGELADRFGIHRDTVSEILNRHSVARRHRGIPPELLGELIASYRSGSSLATIGEELSVDPGTVALALRKSGITLRPRRGWRTAEDWTGDVGSA